MLDDVQRFILQINAKDRRWHSIQQDSNSNTVISKAKQLFEMTDNHTRVLDTWEDDAEDMVFYTTEPKADEEEE